MKPELVTLHINGRTHTLALAPNVTLLHALRDLGYVDVKCGCEQGDCGACAVKGAFLQRMTKAEQK